MTQRPLTANRGEGFEPLCSTTWPAVSRRSGRKG